MEIYKIFVDDRDFDNNDGFDLYSDNPEEIAYAVKIAIRNGFKDIRISAATQKELAKENLYYKTDWNISKNNIID